MLSAVGIIAEYNPFHNGHSYQLKLARQRTNADVVIAIMSGNWVQRGAPAIVDKWTRAKMALAAGVDMVVELPVFGAVQSADRFAQTAMAIVDQLKCDALAFGSEHPEYDFTKLGAFDLAANSNHFQNYQHSYAKLIRDEIKNQLGIQIDQPNDVLAWNYAIAKHQLDSDVSLVPIQRIGSRHHDQKLNASIASASAIRRELLTRDLTTIESFIPVSSYQLLKRQQWLDWQTFWPLLRYQLITTPLEILKQRYQMTEGLEYRLKAAAVKYPDFNAFINAVKTKRYTFSRIQRLLVVVLIQANSSAMIDHAPYVRILGFNSIGRQYLNQIKKQIDWPMVSTVNQSVLQSLLAVDFKAGMLIQMQTGECQDVYRHPIIKK